MPLMSVKTLNTQSTNVETKFAEWIIGRDPGLKKHFVKPPKSTYPKYSFSKPEPQYSRLSTSYLLQEAIEFYHERSGVRQPTSIHIVDTLALFLLPPASIVYGFSALISKMKSREPSSASTSGTSISNMRTTVADRLILYSRTWALWVVFVPSTQLKGRGGLKGFLEPFASPEYLNTQIQESYDGERAKTIAETEYNQLRLLYRRSVERRREFLNHLATLPERPLHLRDNNLYQNDINQYKAEAELAKLCKEYMSEARIEVEELEEIAETRACMKTTGYKDLSDWAKDVYDGYSNLLVALTTVCALGAGLTYSTIFSSTRGNIGMMSWAFSLFIVGLVVSVGIQALLMWCSRLHKYRYPFSRPQLWTFILGMGLYGSTAAIVAAISILVVTVLELHFDPDAPEGSPSTPQDSPLLFNFQPRPAGVFAFSMLIYMAIMLFLRISLLVMATGSLEPFFWWRRGHKRHDKRGKSLEDYV